MELFAFGSPATTQSTPSDAKRIPSSLRSSNSAIKVLWSSWCDYIIATQDDSGSWTVEYTGTSLTGTQTAHVNTSKYLKSAFNVRGMVANFFGSAMHDGVRGYVISCTEAQGNVDLIAIFATDVEIENGVREIGHYSMDNEYEIVDIKVLSRGELLLQTTSRSEGAKHIFHLQSMTELRAHLESESLSSFLQSPLAEIHPLQWCTNASTSTLLDQNGKVHTSTCDPRYPRCLGRPYTGEPLKFQPVPYLSETRITKVTSGGYLTAAVSSDGELYLWGQMCPGSNGRLRVLEERAEPTFTDADKGTMHTGISAEGEQDEYVKCLEVRIDGQEARVYDVAIGHGHLLVAAEVGSEQSGRRVVFAAGDNDRGQLGLESSSGCVNQFTEVATLSGQSVQLIAAGWTSFVVSLNG